jgi:hypothetical protein
MIRTPFRAFACRDEPFEILLIAPSRGSVALREVSLSMEGECGISVTGTRVFSARRSLSAEVRGRDAPPARIRTRLRLLTFPPRDGLEDLAMPNAFKARIRMNPSVTAVAVGIKPGARTGQNILRACSRTRRSTRNRRVAAVIEAPVRHGRNPITSGAPILRRAWLASE